MAELKRDDSRKEKVEGEKKGLKGGGESGRHNSSGKGDRRSRLQGREEDDDKRANVKFEETETEVGKKEHLEPPPYVTEIRLER